MNKARLFIAGDLVPTQYNYDVFEKGTARDLLGEKLADLWNAADYRIANLEAPLIDEGMPIAKNGPNLSIPKRCAAGFRMLEISMFGLSNNHIMDYGADGLEQTLEELDANGIQHIGTGKNASEAETGKTVAINGIRVGIYACSEHEFSAAGRNKPGANAIGINTSLRIYELKKISDYVIVLFHGGKERCRYPTPYQQERCRSFADAGADLVVCQHSHCAGCEEIYNGKTLIYGQGNFIFDYEDTECWKTALIIEVHLKKENKTNADVLYHPVSQNGNVVMYASDIQKDMILSEFQKRSDEIKKIGK